MKKWLTLAVVVVGILIVSGVVVTTIKAQSDAADCDISKLAIPRSTWSARGWTSAENRQPGTTAWHLAAASASGGDIAGFANQISIAPGASITLFVRAPQKWRWSAYRLGYYGGAGGRLYGSSCWYPPSHRGEPVTSGSTRTVTAPWKASLTITESWPPGVYLLKLISVSGAESYVPLVVRSPSVQGRTVYMVSAMTMQAYNQWGGRSLYLGPDRSASTRAYADSFDRPFDGHLARQLLAFEQPLIAEAERVGIPLAYLTDIDIASRPQVLAGARTLMTDGHAEYWTLPERRAVIEARDHGTNLLFFGANQMWWQARLGRTALGANRLVICYKHALDPVARTHPQLRTTNFRSLAHPLPESRVIGVQYGGLDADSPFVVYTPGFFAFAHTGARRGTAYPGLVGQEIDTVNPGRNSPATLEIVGRSPATCRKRRCLSESTYYTVASGAAVWAAGTNGWVNALGADIFGLGVTPSTRTFVRMVTDNLLLDFAGGPAGRIHPAVPNVTRADGPPAPTRGQLQGGTD